MNLFTGIILATLGLLIMYAAFGAALYAARNAHTGDPVAIGASLLLTWGLVHAILTKRPVCGTTKPNSKTSSPE